MFFIVIIKKINLKTFSKTLKVLLTLKRDGEKEK